MQTKAVAMQQLKLSTILRTDQFRTMVLPIEEELQYRLDSHFGEEWRDGGSLEAEIHSKGSLSYDTNIFLPVIVKMRISNSYEYKHKVKRFVLQVVKESFEPNDGQVDVRPVKGEKYTSYIFRWFCPIIYLD